MESKPSTNAKIPQHGRGVQAQQGESLMQENIPPDLKSTWLRQTESMLEKIERGGRMEPAGPLGDSLSRRRREISRFSHNLFKCYLNVTRKYIR